MSISNPEFKEDTPRDLSINSTGTTEELGTITVTSPSGEDNWQREMTHTIKWTSTGIPSTDLVDVELYKGGIFTGYRIREDTPNDGRTDWAIPSDQTIGSDYKIRVHLISNSSITGYSNNFRIDSGTFSSSHPKIFLNQDEIAVIKNRKNQEPWKSAFNKLMSNANSALNITSYPNVVDVGHKICDGDRHNYCTDNPYSSDGVYNPNADRDDYKAGMKMRDNVRALALAYAFTSDNKYAEQAIKFIYKWCIDPNKKMNPHKTNYQSMIELGVMIPSLWYSADLIWNYNNGKWIHNSVDIKPGFVEWSRKMVDSFKNDFEVRDNNWENWRLVGICTGSVIIGDMSNLTWAFKRFQEYLIPTQISSKGCMKQEIHRTRSLHYCLYGINGLVQIAEIARHYPELGYDLYGYTTNRIGLKLACDLYARYAAYPEKWKSECPCPNPNGADCQMIQGWNDAESKSIYELAYTIYKNPRYKDVMIRWGRPMYEDRTLGEITLTHGSSFL